VTPVRLSSGLRLVALLEAAKGLLVLSAGFGLLSLMHRDVQSFAEQLVTHSHLNPAARYPRIFIDAVSRLSDSRLMRLAAGATAYAAVRFAEAYGLWFARRWAEWFAAVSGAIYIPFELLELTKRTTGIGLALVLVNTAVVAFMLYCVFRAGGRA
jgi:uncharacterized membrane protein (DUF2068 family)